MGYEINVKQEINFPIVGTNNVVWISISSDQIMIEKKNALYHSDRENR